MSLIAASLPPGISSATSASSQASRTPTPTPSTLAARAALAAAIGPGAIVETERPLGALRWVANLDGTLTGPSASAPPDIALGFVRGHLDAFGLTAHDLALLQLPRRLRRHPRDAPPVVGGAGERRPVLRRRAEGGGGRGRLAASRWPGPSITSCGPTGRRRRPLSAGEAVAAARAALEGSGRARGRWTAMPLRPRATRALRGAAGTSALAWDTTTAISPQRIVRSVVDAATAAGALAREPRARRPDRHRGSPGRRRRVRSRTAAASRCP